MSRNKWLGWVFVTAALFSAVGPSPILAAEKTATDTADAVYQAMKSGDPNSVRALMMDDVQIFESGKLEASFEEYADHHLQADMTFFEHLDRSITARHEEESDGLAVVTTLSTVSGTYQGRNMAFRMIDTVVLKRSDDGWKIQAMHWSKR